jgi:predicted RNA polymerase sigma factor
MVSYLSRIFGMDCLDRAEDVVQEALSRALEMWPIHGAPENPSAWLMQVARNRSIDLLRRDEQFRYFVPELVHLLRLRENLPVDVPAFEKEIQGDQAGHEFPLATSRIRSRLPRLISGSRRREATEEHSSSD